MGSDEFEKFISGTFKEGASYGTIENPGIWPLRNYALAKAMGGGAPSSKITTFVGESSSGKTTAAIKLAAEVGSTSWKTGKQCDPLSDESCNVLVIDQEGTLDESWCKMNGFHPNEGGNKVMSFREGSDAIDTITAAIRSGNFSLIVLDSIDTVVPAEENEKSAADLVVGKKAILLNRAFRSWTVNLTCESKKFDKWWRRPTMCCINQIRHGIGTYVEESYPGGRGQYYYSSLFVRMGKPGYDNSKDRKKQVKFGKYKGFVKKNKTNEPNTPFEFDMALSDLPELGLEISDIDNISALFKDAKAMLKESEGGGYELFGHKFRIKNDLLDRLRAEPEFEREIMFNVVNKIRQEEDE